MPASPTKTAAAAAASAQPQQKLHQHRPQRPWDLHEHGRLRFFARPRPHGARRRWFPIATPLSSPTPSCAPHRAPDLAPALAPAPAPAPVPHPVPVPPLVPPPAAAPEPEKVPVKAPAPPRANGFTPEHTHRIAHAQMPANSPAPRPIPARLVLPHDPLQHDCMQPVPMLEVHPAAPTRAPGPVNGSMLDRSFQQGSLPHDPLSHDPSPQWRTIKLLTGSGPQNTQLQTATRVEKPAAAQPRAPRPKQLHQQPPRLKKQSRQLKQLHKPRTLACDVTAAAMADQQPSLHAPLPHGVAGAPAAPQVTYPLSGRIPLSPLPAADRAVGPQSTTIGSTPSHATAVAPDFAPASGALPLSTSSPLLVPPQKPFYVSAQDLDIVKDTSRVAGVVADVHSFSRRLITKMVGPSIQREPRPPSSSPSLASSPEHSKEGGNCTLLQVQNQPKNMQQPYVLARESAIPAPVASVGRLPITTHTDTASRMDAPTQMPTQSSAPSLSPLSPCSPPLSYDPQHHLNQLQQPGLQVPTHPHTASGYPQGAFPQVPHRKRHMIRLQFAPVTAPEPPNPPGLATEQPRPSVQSLERSAASLEAVPPTAVPPPIRPHGRVCTKRPSIIDVDVLQTEPSHNDSQIVLQRIAQRPVSQLDQQRHLHKHTAVHRAPPAMALFRAPKSPCSNGVLGLEMHSSVAFNQQSETDYATTAVPGTNAALTQAGTENSAFKTLAAVGNDCTAGNDAPSLPLTSELSEGEAKTPFRLPRPGMTLDVFWEDSTCFYRGRVICRGHRGRRRDNFEILFNDGDRLEVSLDDLTWREVEPNPAGGGRAMRTGPWLHAGDLTEASRERKDMAYKSGGSARVFFSAAGRRNANVISERRRLSVAEGTNAEAADGAGGQYAASGGAKEVGGLGARPMRRASLVARQKSLAVLRAESQNFEATHDEFGVPRA